MDIMFEQNYRLDGTCVSRSGKRNSRISGEGNTSESISVSPCKGAAVLAAPRLATLRFYTALLSSTPLPHSQAHRPPPPLRSTENIFIIYANTLTGCIEFASVMTSESVIPSVEEESEVGFPAFHHFLYGGDAGSVPYTLALERGKKQREKKYLWGDLGKGLVPEREGGQW